MAQTVKPNGVSRYLTASIKQFTITRCLLLLAHLLLLKYFLFGSKKMTTFVELNNGQKMPAVGLGTWQVTNDSELSNALEEALKAGYRHIDTAYLYTNEEIIGNVLEKWLSSGKIKREELFIVTKLPSVGMAPERVGHFLKLSLKALKLDYVDLYLIHSPVGLNYLNDKEQFPMKDGKVDIDMGTDLEAIWKAMEEQVDAGLTKSIGLSNYNIGQIERMMKVARIPPANLQVELHAYFQQKPLQEVCKKHKITICAYAPLGSPGRKALFEKRGMTFEELGLLHDPVVTGIAEKFGKTPSQVLLRFLVQQGIVAIPKSTNPNRLLQNIQVFDFGLTDEDMESMKKLDKGLEGRSFTGKAFKGIDEHPEFSYNSF